MDISNLTDEQLDLMIQKKQQGNNLSSVSNEDLDRMIAEKQQVQPTNNLENTISQRRADFPDLTKTFVPPSNPLQRVLSVPARVGSNAMHILGTLGARGQAIGANIAEGVQQKKINPALLPMPAIAYAANPTYRQAVNQAITGKRIGEYGDIGRRAGLPEPVNVLGGLGVDLAMGNVITKGALGTAGKQTAKGLGENIQGMTKFIGQGNKANFAEGIRNKFVNLKTQAVNRFGNQIDDLAKANPTKTISLREIVDNLLTDIDELSPQARSAIKGNPILKKFLENPELADNVSLKDTQEIINHFNTKVPKNIRFNHLDILNTLNDIKAAQLDAFPEMANVRYEYAKFKQPYDLIKNQFKVGKLLKAIEKDFGDPEFKKAVTQIFPKEVIKEMGGYKNAERNLRIMGKILKGASIGGAFTLGGYIVGRTAQKVLTE